MTTEQSLVERLRAGETISGTEPGLSALQRAASEAADYIERLSQSAPLAGMETTPEIRATLVQVLSTTEEAGRLLGYHTGVDKMLAVLRDHDRLSAALAASRGILAGTDYPSLPNDWTLEQVAQARMDDIQKYMDQVRHTCARAEKAEARLAEVERERDEARDALAAEKRWFDKAAREEARLRTAAERARDVAAGRNAPSSVTPLSALTLIVDILTAALEGSATQAAPALTPEVARKLVEALEARIAVLEKQNWLQRQVSETLAREAFRTASDAFWHTYISPLFGNEDVKNNT